MNEHGPMLVPLDGSELAEAALPIAAEVARAERTHLVLLSVWKEPGSGTPAAVSMEMEERARDYFETYLAGVRNRLGQPAIRTVVRCGEAGDAILAVAEELGARMIVVASHGRSGIGRWLYGSTASRILHDSTCAVLVVGPNVLGTKGHSQIRHVMVPLDGSRLSELAVAAGGRLASALTAKLSLVRVVRWAYQSYPYADAVSYTPSLDSELEAGAREYLRESESLVKTGVEAQAFVLRGLPADALLNFEDEKGVDLVVMTTHARSGVLRAALGSTAERVIQGTAPVLLLRPEGDNVNEQRDPAGQAART